MLKETAFGDVEQELANTRQVLAALPDEHWAWRPSERSWSLGELGTHVANLLDWQLSILKKSEYDLASTPAAREAASGSDALLDEFDERVDDLRKALEEADDASFGEDWILRHADEVILRMPRAAALRSFGLSHMIHHRGQLVVYLRLLDQPVPGIYGPSADEGAD